MAHQEDYEEVIKSKFGQLHLDEDQGGAEKVVECTMLSWNTNYGSPGKGYAAIRDTIICVVKEPTESYITFMQEVQIGAKAVREKWAFGAESTIAMPMGAGIREAAVSTPPSGKRLQYDPGEILDDFQLKGKGMKVEFAARMCGQKVILKRKIGGSEYSASTAILSYHACYKEGNKKDKMLEYFKEMCRFANKLEQTIVIGGDFNLPVLDWKEEVENEFPNQVFVALYLGTPRRWACDKLIDTFAIVQPSESVHRTEAIFEETTAIYPFPLSCNKGGEKTTLSDYPSSDSATRWFKYVNFSD